MNSIMKLGDLVEFQRGYDLPKEKAIYGQYRVVTSNGTMVYHNKFKSEPSIVIGRSGTVGNPQLIKERFWPHNTTLYVKDFKGNNLEYIYYLLLNMDIGRMKSGSNIPTLNRNHLHPLLINATNDIVEQKRIAEILSKIDSKILNNNAINMELESIAKTIYDYWFLQFDFPDENGKPYKSSGGKMVWNEKMKQDIPEDWKVTKLENLCTFSNGINYDKNRTGDKNYKIVNVRNITDSSLLLDSGTFDIINLLSSQADKYLVEPYDILIARSGTPGAIRILFTYEENIIYCGFIIRCSLNEKKQRLFLTYTLKNLEGSNVTKTGGSIMQNVSQETLKQIDVYLPSDEVIDRYNEIIIPLISKMQECIKENQELTSLRDFLLPLLMNGQIGFR